MPLFVSLEQYRVLQMRGTYKTFVDNISLKNHAYELCYDEEVVLYMNFNKYKYF